MIFLFCTLILIIILTFYFSKSSFTDNPKNVLIVACHFKTDDSVLRNNLEMMSAFNLYDIIIIVYSKDKNAVVNNDLNAIYIEDTLNRYYDFYKYKMGYDYIKTQNIQTNWVTVMNDSIIITEPVYWIVGTVLLDTQHDFIGMLEINHNLESHPDLLHYQSWWINFKPAAFDYWASKLIFNERYTDINNIITDYEVGLGNEMINTFKSTALFPLELPNYHNNIFYDDPVFYHYYYNRNFKFVKLKNIKPDLLPKKLKLK
jgi:hypothetical protein